MAAADQIKTLIKAFAEGDDARFYSTAMQIAASEARMGHNSLAEDLKNLIDHARKEKSKLKGVVRSMPISASQKELNDLLSLVEPEMRMKDLVFTPDQKKSIRRILDEQKKLELLKEHNLEPRKKLLFVGPPGCGKTVTAGMLAAELGIPLFVIRLDGLISRYMGDSIAKLRLIFDAMHQFKAVYLFDEFDSIGTMRSHNNDVGEIKRVLNSFLLHIENDNSQSLIIAATNLPEQLDFALFRRFDDIIRFELPSREQILKLYHQELQKYPFAKNIDLERVSQISLGLSYADIHRICEDMVKEILVYQEAEISEEELIGYVRLRKSPFN
ncbi:ATP-binding protein [Sediminibacterium sp.]|uniref:AAA family ATPase n=1 Tax=Sediminibacterium sp. TaxID=1917865 RepID=UPI0025D4BFD3|nr:ATP-binding protein [Sediminibacterium sp.]